MTKNIRKIFTCKTSLLHLGPLRTEVITFVRNNIIEGPKRVSNLGKNKN